MGLCAFACGTALSAGAPLVEMTALDTKHQGRIVVANKSRCWLAQPDGRIHQLLLGSVTEFRKLPGEFRPYTTARLRDELRSELKGTWDIEIVGSHVVCAATGRARSYAALLDSAARGFAGYVSRRSLPVQKMEFPLVTIVFPNWNLFRAYADAEGVTATSALRGYYNPTTNRIALYEGSPDAGKRVQLRTIRMDGPDLADAAKVPLRWPGREADQLSQSSNPFHVKRSDASLPVFHLGAVTGASLQGTLIHEAIHQLAFNSGLHSRYGDDPRWVVEGFAMLLEEESHLRDDKGASAGDRANLERYTTFQGARGKRPKDVLRQMIASDGVFQTNPLNAYAEAWALTFFLTETRSAKYADYLKRIAQRDRLEEYSSDDRLKDFQAAFGKDLVILDAQLLEFMSKLKVRGAATK